MPPEWVTSDWEYQRWLEQTITDAGAHVLTDNGILHIGEVLVEDDTVVGLEVLRRPEQLLMFWQHRRVVVFDMLVDLHTMQIDRCHFVLRGPPGPEPPHDRDDVILRICRDDFYVGMVGCAWHEHKGSEGEREARPEWDDWDVDDVLAYLRDVDG